MITPSHGFTVHPLFAGTVSTCALMMVCGSPHRAATYAPVPSARGTSTTSTSSAPSSARARESMRQRVKAIGSIDPSTQRVVLINPNASELLPHRRWMPARYAELIQRIIKQYPDALVLITGAPNERAEAEALAKQCGPRCVSLAGHTALADLPALYSLAKLMVTNDSGPSHFAAASGLRATLDEALAGPPADCAQLTALTQRIGEDCKACHRDFR